MPEDFKTYIQRLLVHAQKQLEMAAKALENEEYDTLEFLAHVAVLDLTKLREVVNTQLRFSKKQ